jgi:AcrR family transcriptional regulator
MPRAERESQMMAVAEEVFSERGYVDASMDEIAERVGVSKPMLYEYFGSKEGLLVACVRQASAELHRATSEAAAAADTPENKLRNGLLAYFEFIRRHNETFLVLSSQAAALAPSAHRELEAARRQQTDLITMGLAECGPRPAPVELTAMAEIIVGGCERLALYCHQNPEIGPEQAAEMVMTLTWYGLRPAAPGGSD